jgi:type I restriction enzyme R subunit
MLDDLHKSFAMLTQEEQKVANIFLHDVQSGNAKMENGKTFRDYITEYQSKAKNDQIQRISRLLGVNEKKLRNLLAANVSEANINEFGRFDDLKASVDKVKAKEYFEELENAKIPPFKINIKVHNLLQQFVLLDGFDIDASKEIESAESLEKGQPYGTLGDRSQMPLSAEGGAGYGER